MIGRGPAGTGASVGYGEGSDSSVGKAVVAATVGLDDGLSVGPVVGEVVGEAVVPPLAPVTGLLETTEGDIEAAGGAVEVHVTRSDSGGDFTHMLHVLARIYFAYVVMY